MYSLLLYFGPFYVRWALHYDLSCIYIYIYIYMPYTIIGYCPSPHLTSFRIFSVCSSWYLPLSSRSIWWLLRVAIVIHIHWWGTTTRTQFHLHILHLIYWRLLPSLPIRPKKESMRTCWNVQPLVLRVFNWLTYSNFWTVLVIRLKLSNDCRNLRFTSGSMIVPQTCWLLYFPRFNCSGLTLITTLHAKNKSHQSILLQKSTESP